MTRTGAHGPGPSARAIRIVFVLTGLYFGWRWTSDGHGPPWQHALRVAGHHADRLGPRASHPVVAYPPRQSRRRHGPVPLTGPDPFELLLVALALAAEYLLHRWMPPTHAQFVVGVCLGAAIAVGGPIVHRRHNGPTRAASPTTTSAPTR